MTARTRDVSCVSHVDVAASTHLRWVVFTAVSLGMHGMFLVTAPAASTWHSGAPFGTMIDGRLAAAAEPMQLPAAQPAHDPSNVPAATPQPTGKRVRAPRPASQSSGPFAEAHYAKAGALSVRPSPIGEISVPSPDRAAVQGVVTTKLTLFIDENGTVAKLTFDDPKLSRPFREAAQSAFAKARFNPGRIGDRPVKSRMRIELTFVPKWEDDISGAGAQTRR